MPQLNFIIEKTNTAIYGLETKGRLYNGNIVKEFIIDVNGEEKGPNEIGKDRVTHSNTFNRQNGRTVNACKL